MLCWASSAKLSILAKLVGCELIVFDSFEGLPVAEPNELQRSPLPGK